MRGVVPFSEEGQRKKRLGRGKNSARKEDGVSQGIRGRQRQRTIARGEKREPPHPPEGATISILCLTRRGCFAGSGEERTTKENETPGGCRPAPGFAREGGTGTGSRA